MRILRNWDDIGASVRELKIASLPLHTDPAKCWDFRNIQELMSRNGIKEDEPIIDLGCGASVYGAVTLEFLRKMGYQNLLGIDLFIPFYARLGAVARGWKIFGEFKPYRLIRGNITDTKLPAESCSVAILLSVVEHGVNLERLFGELSRITKPGGCVYLSTDYWEHSVSSEEQATRSGARDNKVLPWRIFDAEGIRDLLKIAQSFGFQESGGVGEIPPCADRPVYWHGVDYTFIALEFKKL